MALPEQIELAHHLKEGSGIKDLNQKTSLKRILEFQKVSSLVSIYREHLHANLYLALRLTWFLLD